MDEGKLWLHGKTPEQVGMPIWRSKIMYVPQRTAMMDSTPREFVEEVRKFNAHKSNKNAYDDPVQIALDWGIRPDLWGSKWSNLSGGEVQRISLAIGCSFRPEILLLDEPTSALDEESCEKVEKTLRNLNCLWITHSPQQAHRVSTAGTLVLRGGDGSTDDNLSDVVIEPNGQNSHAKGSSDAKRRSTSSVSTHVHH
ncbi:hypothetical protein BGZ76_005065 [Entomortierella beljakovae]|nr:hypothetical protein BGZ76_005065 [Entomortierella beljakovae]